MTGNISKRRVSLITLLMVLGLLLAGCGAEATPTTAPPAATNTTAAAAATDTTAPAQPTATTAAAASTPTTVAMATTPTASSAVTPTEAAGATPSTGGSAVAPTPVSSWKPGAHANSVPAPSKLVSGGTLTVGSDVSYPPQEYMDASNNPIGFDMDVASEIASRLGLQSKVVNFNFNDIIPALNAGQFDMVISAMNVTPDRSKAVNFVPYYAAGQSVLVPKGNPKNIKTLDDLSGLTVAVQQGTTEQDSLNAENAKLSQAGKPQITILTYPTDTDAVDQLRVGRADAAMDDDPVAAYYTLLNPNFEVALAGYSPADEGIAIALNNKDMQTAIAKAVSDMKSDGTLDAIKAKWKLK
jgi:polar amino acid transport system substrate-binding protein